jgi:hypothetical protein
MKCSECGAENFDGADHCVACGAPMGSAPDTSSDLVVPESRLPQYGSRNSMLVLGGVVVVSVVLVLAALLTTSQGGGGGGGGSAVPTATAASSLSTTTGPVVTRSQVESRVAADMQAVKKRDYASIYAKLPGSDRASVSAGGWQQRNDQVQQALGDVKSYAVSDVEYLDQAHTVVEAKLMVQFSKSKVAVPSTLYYLLANGALAPTMLWGREMTVSPEPVR